jgi:hypothetical protein
MQEFKCACGSTDFLVQEYTVWNAFSDDEVTNKLQANSISENGISLITCKKCQKEIPDEGMEIDLS